jgi:hypothetical protein
MKEHEAVNALMARLRKFAQENQVCARGWLAVRLLVATQTHAAPAPFQGSLARIGRRHCASHTHPSHAAHPTTQVHCWLVAHPRQFGNMWQGQRPGLQDISGGANFANKADNGIVVHRDWSKLKEMQQRAAAAAAAGRGQGGGGKPSRAKSGAAELEPGAAAAHEAAQAAADALAECEVQIIVEKV